MMMHNLHTGNLTFLVPFKEKEGTLSFEEKGIFSI
jgi:hypothetical protein